MCSVCRPTASKEQDVVNHSGKINNTNWTSASWTNSSSCMMTVEWTLDEGYLLLSRTHWSVLREYSHIIRSRFELCQSPMRSDWSECVVVILRDVSWHRFGWQCGSGPWTDGECVLNTNTPINIHINMFAWMSKQLRSEIQWH